MPIDARHFERGVERGSIEREIVRFLHANDERAYDVYEVTTAVMGDDWCEADPGESFESELSVEQILDVATVKSILERLVHNGGAERRVVDAERGKRPFYRAVVT
ncbi:hypothetical protein [Halorussus halophilus]|uniref:hypothetical protein n=1 Tax=Halorussus halophilus TaxID=2650975 RepID=UPI0013012A9D|nr:hypothetical protein [Halorussus halophilus]